MKNTTTKQKNGKSALGFIRAHAGREKRWFALAVLCTAVAIVANYLIPQVISFTVDSVLGEEPAAPGFALWALQAFGGREALRGALLWCALGVILCALLAGVFNFVARYGIARATETFCKNLRDKLFSHVQRLPFKWHVQNQTGDIIQRCTSDLEVVQRFVQGQLLEVLRTLLQIGLALAIMFSMNVKLTLVSLVFIPLIGGYSTLFYSMVGKRFLAADEAEGALMVAVQENLTGVRVVRAFGREEYEMEHFEKYNGAFADLWLRLGKTLSLYWGTGDIATGLQIFAVVCVGAVLAARGEITLGAFLVFVSYNQQLAWPIRALGRTLSEMSKTGVSAGRIQQILDAEPEPAEPNAQKPDLGGDIVFSNVTFAYGDNEVLRDVSFTVPAGSTFGILGATGSGKSTITYLLNRLYDLPEGLGSITVGGVDVRDIDRAHLRRGVGLVLQEPFLFSKTIEENIAIAVADAPRSEVRRAARTAAVDGAITRFTHGYDTVVGERGVTLSGGQKQRVAIARTLMLDAPVMVFDDSLSAVDLDTDTQIRAALRENTHGATVLLISHRINTLMDADRILVLEDGHVADIGTHQELIHRPGLYKRIYDMQASHGTEGGEG